MATKPHKGELTDKQRMAISFVVAGLSHREAGIKAGYAKSSSEVTVCRMLKKDKGKAYHDKLKAKAEKKAEEKAVGHILSKHERKVWLSSAITTPLDKVDASSDLCTESLVTEDYHRIKKIDPLKAMDILNKMDEGYTPQKVEHSGLESFFANLQPQQGLHNDTGGNS